MIKQFKKYNSWHDGLNSVSDPRDISDIEISDVNNFIFDQPGLIRHVGALVQPTGLSATEAIVTTKGYGLFVFKADYDMPSKGSISSVANNGSGYTRYTASSSHGLSTDDIVFHWDFSNSVYNGYKTITVIGATTYDTTDTYTATGTGSYIEVSEANEASETYVALADTTNGEISICPLSDNVWVNAMIDFTGTAIPIYYYVDGGLRVVDVNLVYGQRWFGYIDRTICGHAYNQWYESTALLLKPTNGFVCLPDGSGYSGLYGRATDDNNSANTTLRSQNALAWLSATNTQLDADDFAVYALNLTMEDVGVRTDDDDITTSPLPLTTTANFTDPGGGVETRVEWTSHGLLTDDYVIVTGTTNYDGTYQIDYVDVNHFDITIAYVADETGNVAAMWRNKYYYIFPPEGSGVCLALLPAGTDGSWEAGTYIFGSTLIYDRTQESLIYEMAGTSTITANQHLQVYRITGRLDYNLRVTGARVYYKKQDSREDWKILINMDFERNSYQGGLTGSEYTFTAIDDKYITSTGSSLVIYDPPASTYESINGFPDTTVALHTYFKHATVLNRRVWACNTRAQYISGSAYIRNGDRIAYTPVGKYDTFPTDYDIELGLNDGDEFTAIQGYADRLLAFKKEKLHIINVSQGSDTGWYLESSHDFMGVVWPAATYKADIGIIWVNENGCFLYDGNQIHNLIEGTRNGIKQRLISVTVWTTFITDDAIIGYDPNYRQIVVLGDCDSVAGAMYIFDLATGSWTKGTAFAQAAGSLYTNFDNIGSELITGVYTT